MLSSCRLSPCWPVVLFDLDGTLVDTMDLIVRSYQVAFREVLGTQMDPASLRPLVGMTLPDALGGYDGQVDALIHAYRAYNLAHLEDDQRDYDGIDALLRDLGDAGAQVGVVTSKSRPTAVRSLDAAHLGELAPLLVAQLDTERHKPHPEPLLKAMSLLGADPAETVYVGDSTWDLLAAKAAGVSAIGVTWGAGTRETLEATEPDHVVDTRAELAALLLSEETAR